MWASGITLVFDDENDFQQFKHPSELGTPNLDSLNVNKRADYSSYNTAVDLLTALSDVID
jgi:hypothetical protein